MGAQLDFYFPFLVFAYGTIMTFVTHLPLSKDRSNGPIQTELLEWFYSHKILGVVCFFVGGLWSLQKLFV